MNPVVCFRSSINLNSRSAGRIKAAEQELAAFFHAVKQLFGREQAELSAKDWLDALAEYDGLPASTRDWRSITVKASTRLATRVNASSLSAAFTNA
jgi:alkylhydroperoxidase/carboxymuconolactone decarboxylase family protein YurZ